MCHFNELSIEIESKNLRSAKKIFHCPYEECGKKYSRPSLLEQHLRTHSNERPFVCDYTGCSKAFYRKSHLKIHKRCHTNVKPFSCHYDGCDAQFYTQQHLERHIEVHRKPKPYACTWEGCDECFSKHQQLRSHISACHTHLLPYPCTYQDCEQRFATKQKLQNHVNRAHEKIISYSCPHESCVGHEGFEKWSQLQNHIREAHVPSCSICGRQFKTAAHLRHHVVLHQTTLEERKTYHCPMEGCKKSFTRSSALKKHISVIHEGNMAFHCDSCGTKFGYKHMLQRHLERGTCKKAHKPYINECGIKHDGVEGVAIHDQKEKELSSNLVSDVAKKIINEVTGHGYEEAREYSCSFPECNYRFKRLYDMHRHLNSHH